jgi:hypothetical protein
MTTIFVKPLTSLLLGYVAMTTYAFAAEGGYSNYIPGF